MSELLEHAMTTAKQPEMVRVSANPMGILELAISQGAGIDQLTKLMELQERWEANEARKAFNAAFSAFKSEAVAIIKNVTVTDGPLKNKKYADLFGVVNAVTPVMSKHGLTHSWKLTKDEPAWMEVTCTIKHELGHSESVSMGAAPDTGPGRNAIQARGSAKSYLERYTLLAATGMAASGTDDDGNKGGASSNKNEMPIERFSRNMELLETAPNVNQLQKNFNDAFKESELYRDEAAKKNFISAKDARKKELNANR